MPVFTGVVDAQGRLRLEAAVLFKVWIAKHRNQAVQLVLKKLARHGTHKQDKYLFGVIYPILAEHCGYRTYEVAEVHDGVMRQLRGLKPEPNPLLLRVSWAEMDMEQRKEYIDDVRYWALDKFNCVIPDAEKVEATA